jgi:hypothetical protein
MILAEPGQARKSSDLAESVQLGSAGSSPEMTVR